MAVDGVFVYSDGQVGLRSLPDHMANKSTHRILRTRPMQVSWVDESELGDEIFTKSGKMFDGRPVFTADGFKLEVANIDAFAGPEEAHIIEEFLPRELEKLVRQKYPDAIELDRTLRREALDDRVLIKLAMRMMVAVRVSESLDK